MKTTEDLIIKSINSCIQSLKLNGMRPDYIKISHIYKNLLKQSNIEEIEKIWDIKIIFV